MNAELREKAREGARLAAIAGCLEVAAAVQQGIPARGALSTALQNQLEGITDGEHRECIINGFCHELQSMVEAWVRGEDPLSGKA